MRSTNFLAFFLLAFVSILQLTIAEPVLADDLVERGSVGLDIAPVSGSPQKSLDGGFSLSKSKSEKLVCPARTGLCPNDPGACCPLGGRCCGNKKCCKAGAWCYSNFCCPTTSNGCDGKGCCAKGWNCCKGGSCCQPGYYCIRSASGQIRCCPNGKTCYSKDAKPAEKAGATA